MTQNPTIRRPEAGFTLVELAVVMIIIGLLLGGVLKGQELITNAQITSSVAQVKATDAATTTFRDMYNALPGDLIHTVALPRIPSCVSATCVIGNGDGTIGTAAMFGTAPAVDERSAFWLHLNAADLITGINPTQGNVWGGNFPDAAVRGGGFHVGFNNGAIGGNMLALSQPRAGTYLALHGTAAGAVNNGAGSTALLTANQASRIDLKLDDGQPLTGTVIAAGAAACGVAAAGTTIYNESVAQTNCNLYIRFQN